MTRRHIPALDGVRGLAILLVLVAHLTVWGTSTADAVSRNVALLGFSGVDLFFVLSGFLITRLLWTDLENARQDDAAGSTLRRFWIRRVLRIWPLYLAALVGLFVVLPALKGWSEYPMPELWADRWYYWLHATNIKAALQNDLGLPYNTGHFWSLAVEEQFYLVWPFLLWRVRTLAGLRRLCFALIAGAWILRIAFGDLKAGYVLMPPRMDGLALGALIFAISETGDLARWRRPALVAGLVALLVGVPAMWLRTSSTVADVLLGLAASIFHAALLTAVLSGSASRLDKPWLRMLGRYSYGIYVIHFPLILVLRPAFALAGRLPALGTWTLPTAITTFTLGSICATVLAVASYHLFERHFLRLKDRLAPARDRDTPGRRRRALVEASGPGQ